MSEPKIQSHIEFPSLGEVCRLGLATRGNTKLDPEDVLYAIEWGINFLNWCGYDDGIAKAVQQLGSKRNEVAVSLQLRAKSVEEAKRELDDYLQLLGTDHIELITHYYVEGPSDWNGLTQEQSVRSYLEQLKAQGIIQAIGITTHDRDLAGEVARMKEVDAVMVRYNAAHRGAQEQIFPYTHQNQVPVIAYTALRWGKLLESTPDDPHGFNPPAAPSWYKYVLENPAVDLCLFAPNGRNELMENLDEIQNWEPLDPNLKLEMEAHGDRVRQAHRYFP